MFRSNHMFLCVVLLVTIALFASATLAASPVKVELSGNVHTTPRTGYKGATFTLGDPKSSDFALWGLYSKERSDDPCWVQVNNESVNNTSTKSGAVKGLCGPKGPKDSSLLSADFADGDFTGERAFATGVKVCMNRAETKVKGWVLYGKKITDSGTLVDLTTHALAGPRAHCHE